MVDVYPELPKRLGDAAINDSCGFEDHPDFERAEDGRGLRHLPSGRVYLGTIDGKAKWSE